MGDDANRHQTNDPPLTKPGPQKMDATHACVAQNPLGVHPSKEVHTAADGQPNEEVVTSTPPSLSIKVQPANPSDSPDLVVLELTTFVNDPISQHMKPLRPQLLQSGVAPEQWPDYQAMLRRRHRSIVNGEIVFKAVIPIEGGRADTKGKIVGMAHMVPPKRLRRKVSVKDRVWSSLLHPTYEGFRWFMPDEAKANGGDEVFAERFRTMIARTREEVMNGREHFAL